MFEMVTSIKVKGKDARQKYLYLASKTWFNIQCNRYFSDGRGKYKQKTYPCFLLIEYIKKEDLYYESDEELLQHLFNHYCFEYTIPARVFL
jgi:hypothetical protein